MEDFEVIPGEHIYIPFAELLGNDSYPENSEITINRVQVDDLDMGVATISTEGVFFKAHEEFIGEATVSYTLADANGGEDTATVTIHVGEPSEEYESFFINAPTVTILTDTNDDGTLSAAELADNPLHGTIDLSVSFDSPLFEGYSLSLTIHNNDEQRDLILSFNDGELVVVNTLGESIAAFSPSTSGGWEEHQHITWSEIQPLNATQPISVSAVLILGHDISDTNYDSASIPVTEPIRDLAISDATEAQLTANNPLDEVAAAQATLAIAEANLATALTNEADAVMNQDEAFIETQTAWTHVINSKSIAENELGTAEANLSGALDVLEAAGNSGRYYH
ncbi:Ig-like domain-containing protein [Shewanella surugensis]|uniref:Cadherin-like domain-containing protein n=1 Tax=Shewanella surugensis TaxID=212020 RepID=A0ABT0LGK0_9GAMM|nr:cadherin-like domain-containing protein [Shewanella surugensis]MCL1126669.1 cadherin-like domain-containing protein [Shewanella surugensis]